MGEVGCPEGALGPEGGLPFALSSLGPAVGAAGRPPLAVYRSSGRWARVAAVRRRPLGPPGGCGRQCPRWKIGWVKGGCREAPPWDPGRGWLPGGAPSGPSGGCGVQCPRPSAHLEPGLLP